MELQNANWHCTWRVNINISIIQSLLESTQDRKHLHAQVQVHVKVHVHAHVGAVTCTHIHVHVPSILVLCMRHDIVTKLIHAKHTNTHTHIICDRTHGHCQSHAWSLRYHGGGCPLTVLRSIHTVLATTTEHQKYSCTLCAG